MTIILWILAYAIEIMKYSLLYKIYFDKKMKKSIWAVVVTCIYFIAIIWKMNIVVMYLMVLLSVFFIMDETGLAKLGQLVSMFFCLTCMDEIIAMLIDFLGARGYQNDLHNILRNLTDSLGTFILVVLLVFVKSHLKEESKEKLKSIARKNVFWAVNLMSAFMLFTIAGLNYARKYISNQRTVFFIIILCISAYLSVGLLGVLASYICRINEKVNCMLQNEILLKNMQKHYYDTLLEREENTRRYRHDMNNHLICLQNYAEQGNVSALQNYLAQMMDEQQKICQTCYDTGNEILSMVTNYYVSMLTPDIAVTVMGKVSDVGDDMKLCTIYANLLQNAVEEVQRENENRAKFIEIQFMQGREFFQIMIRNSLSEESLRQEETKLFQSKKEDKRNHGLGLDNVRREIEKKGGKLELKKEDFSYCAIATLKQVKTVR